MIPEVGVSDAVQYTASGVFFKKSCDPESSFRELSNQRLFDEIIWFVGSERTGGKAVQIV